MFSIADAFLQSVGENRVSKYNFVSGIFRLDRFFWKQPVISFSRACISLALGSETQINSMQCRYNPNSPKQDRKSLGEPLYVT